MDLKSLHTLILYTPKCNNNNNNNNNNDNNNINNKLNLLLIAPRGTTPVN